MATMPLHRRHHACHLVTLNANSNRGPDFDANLCDFRHNINLPSGRKRRSRCQIALASIRKRATLLWHNFIGPSNLAAQFYYGEKRNESFLFYSGGDCRIGD